MNVFQTISAVKADLGAVDKNGKMTAGPAKYNYRGIDDVINALHDPLVKHGLVIAPQARRFHQEYGQGSNGNQTRTLVEFDWLVAGPEGDSFVASSVGEAMDTQDKGSNKAGTSAYKQLLCQLLAIPFQTEDPDSFHPDTEAKKSSNAQAKGAGTSHDNGNLADSSRDSGDRGSSAGSTAPVSPPSAPEAAGTTERLCGTCGFVIGPSDAVKRKGGKYHHKTCLDGTSDMKVPTVDPANDITSLIDNFGK